MTNARQKETVVFFETHHSQLHRDESGNPWNVMGQ